MEYLQYIASEIDGYIGGWVLNLIINGIPSILWGSKSWNRKIRVLNLIINGIPSIHNQLWIWDILTMEF